MSGHSAIGLDALIIILDTQSGYSTVCSFGFFRSCFTMRTLCCSCFDIQVLVAGAARWRHARRSDAALQTRRHKVLRHLSRAKKESIKCAGWFVRLFEVSIVWGLMMQEVVGVNRFAGAAEPLPVVALYSSESIGISHVLSYYVVTHRATNPCTCRKDVLRVLSTTTNRSNIATFNAASGAPTPLARAMRLTTTLARNAYHLNVLQAR